MITYEKMDITTVQRGLILHGVNCQGVMGSGVALAIRKKWSDVFPTYQKVCEAFNDPDTLLGMSHFVRVDEELYVGNLFTQKFYGRDGKRYADPVAVAETLEEAINYAKTYNLPVYMPRIGCGLGGLDWMTDVLPVVERLANSNPEVNITVCDL